MTTLIGTNPDQIPVNSMLGGMAYQDPDSISVKDFKYSGNLLGNGDVVFGGLSPIWTSTGRTSLNVNGTSSSIISLSTASSANTSAYLYWDNLDFDIQNNTVGGLVRIGVKDYPDALIISSTGNLGLGVTPVSIGGTNATVHVHGVTGSNPNLRLTNADTGATASDGSAIFVGNAGGAGASSLNIYNCESAPIAFYTAATERMRIDASGNLTLSGTGATKLQEGTTAQRPASPQEGMIRKNSTLGYPEIYSSSQWRGIALKTDTKVVRDTASNANLSGLTSASISISVVGDPEITVKLYGVSSNGAQIPYLILPEDVILLTAAYQSLVTRISNAGAITTYATSVGSSGGTQIPLNTSATSATALLYGTIKIQMHGNAGYYSGVLYSVDGAATATITISGTFSQAGSFNAVGINANGGTFDAGTLGLVTTYSV